MIRGLVSATVGLLQAERTSLFNGKVSSIENDDRRELKLPP